MPHINLFLLFEVAGFIAFAVILAREIYQKNWQRVFEITSCAVFGLILEISDSSLGHTYAYSPNFAVQVMRVPLTIGLAWSVIIYCCMLLSDQLKIPWHLRPFMDALTAILIDLSLDTIAIRLGFWHWTIPLNQEWYGVPFDNFIGWILVVLVFSFLIRFIRTLNVKRTMTKILMFLSPAVAYAGLFLGMVVFGFLAVLPYQINNFFKLSSSESKMGFSVVYYPEVQLWKLIIVVLIMAVLVNVVVGAMIKYRRKYLNHFDLPAFLILTSLHMYCVFLVFYSGIYRQEPYLAFLAIVVFLIHLLMHFLPYLLRPGAVYFFRDIERVLEKEERKVEKVIQAEFK